MHITVKAGWDAEAEVWYIASTDLPGLHLEGATPQELYNQLPRAIEDLLEGIGQQKVLFKFIIPGHKSVPGHVQIAA
jgi:predicted RNase H-like HicB family nuclease